MLWPRFRFGPGMVYVGGAGGFENECRDFQVHNYQAKYKQQQGLV